MDEIQNDQLPVDQLPSDGAEVDPGIDPPTEDELLQHLHDNGWEN